MEKLRNMKDCICSFENLLAAYRAAAENKRYRNEVIQFSLNLEENLLDIQRDLLEGTYTVGKYREFYVNYPKTRLIMALGFRDRVVQHAIYRQINPFIDKRFIRHSYGCREGKGTLAAALQLLNWVQLFSRKPNAKDWVLIKGDVSKYFYRVDHEKVLQSYRTITDDPWFLWLIEAIVNNADVPFGLPPGMDIGDCPKEERLYEVGMPIGNLTSQETANIYLDRLDRFCKFKLRQRYYIRYMDDFIIIARKQDAEDLMDRISAFLKEELRLDISPKSRIVPLLQGCEFVGYRVTPHGIRLRKKTTEHIKSSLNHVSDLYSAGMISYEKAVETINSYLGLLKHCNGYNLQRWIHENIVLRRGAEREDMKNWEARDSPETDQPAGKKFYTIRPRDDGTVDVYLDPEVLTYETGYGVKEYDITVAVVRGVVPWDGLEEDIRARYGDWCASAEKIRI